MPSLRVGRPSIPTGGSLLGTGRRAFSELAAPPDATEPRPTEVPGVIFGRLSTGRLGRALRAHPVVVDAALALLLLVATFPGAFVYQERRWLAVLLNVLVMIPLAWRRKYPMAVFLACMAT